MADRIKVLWLIKGLSPGGAEKLLSMSVPYLNRDVFDYQVAYFIKDLGYLVPEFERQGIPISCLNTDRAYDFRVIFKLYRLLREQKIDILHIHSPYPGIVSRPAAVLAGVKAIMSTEHELFEKYHPLTRMGSILTYPFNKVTIAVSSAVANSVLRSKTIRPKTLRVIHNGVNMDYFENIQTDPVLIKQLLGIDRKSLVVGNVAHIRGPQKGHKYRIESVRLALARDPDVTFVCVGAEQQKGALVELKELARRLGIRDRVIFTGLRHDVPQLLTAFDIFVLPSLSEGFGIVLLEAMCSEKPIVATRVGGILEVIDDGVNGFLVPPANPESLAQRILELLRDETLRKKMGQNGRQKVRDSFSIEHMVKTVEQVYLSVLNARDGS